MTNIKLDWEVTTTPDFNGFKFFVEEGQLFEAEEYARVYKIHVSDIDDQDINNVQDAASRLIPGYWLEVTHN